MADEKQRRREVANRIHVKASPGIMSQEEFMRNFLDEHVIINRDIVESTTQSMFCDACSAEVSGNGAARLMHQLHVSIEADPLRNFWRLALVRCFGCGFEEHIPLDMPNFGAFDMPDKRDAWEQEREKFWQEKKRQEQAGSMYAAQQASIAQMMGVNPLQNQAAGRMSATEANIRAQNAASKLDAISNQALGHQFDEMMRLAEESISRGVAPPKGILEALRDRLVRKKT